jgi:hypothetical protein
MTSSLNETTFQLFPSRKILLLFCFSSFNHSISIWSDPSKPTSQPQISFFAFLSSPERSHVCFISVLIISVVVLISYEFSQSAALSVSETFARFPFRTTVNFLNGDCLPVRLRLPFRLARRFFSTSWSVRSDGTSAVESRRILNLLIDFFDVSQVRRARPYPHRGRLWTLIIVAAVILLTASVAFFAVQTRRAIATTQDSRSNLPFVPPLNWSAQWWLRPDFGRSPLPHMTGDCLLCVFTPTQTDPFSSPSDITIAVAMSEIHGLPTTIRPMRKANISAALVILADSVAVR